MISVLTTAATVFEAQPWDIRCLRRGRRRLYLTLSTLTKNVAGSKTVIRVPVGVQMTDATSATQTLFEFQQGMDQRFQQFQQSASQLNQMPASPEKLTSSLGVIQQLYGIEQFIYSFLPRAQALTSSGFPELATRIDSAAGDVRNAIQMYVNMYQDTARTLQQIGQIIGSAQQFAINNQLESIAHQREVFDASMRGILAVNERRCANCGLYFGDTYSYWSWCPRCGAQL